MFGSHTLASEGSTSSWPCALGRGDPLENKKNRQTETWKHNCIGHER